MSEAKANSNIETICYNYSFMNFSIGDIDRIKEQLKKYKELDNGLKHLNEDINSYIKYYEEQRNNCTMKIETMKRFLKESDYEQFFVEESNSELR